MQGGNGEEERDGDETDEEHALGFLTLNADGFLLDFDDAVASPCRDRAHTGFVFVLLVRIDQDILERVTRQKFGHRPGQHGLPRARIANHQHVAALLCRFADDDRARFLSDDLIHQTVGDGDVLRGGHSDAFDPGLDGGLQNVVVGLTKDGLVRGVVGFGRPNGDLNVAVNVRHGLVETIGLVQRRSQTVVGGSAHGLSCVRLPFEAFSGVMVDDASAVHCCWSRYCWP